jgi:uncharacterized protein with von Willebrand factor type A (vWA) domain
MLQPLLRLLVVECGPFLGDVATRELCASLDAEGKAEQAQVLRANSLLRAVGCTGAADVASLVQHFEAAVHAHFRQRRARLVRVLQRERDARNALAVAYTTTTTGQVLPLLIQPTPTPTREECLSDVSESVAGNSYMNYYYSDRTTFNIYTYFYVYVFTYGRTDEIKCCYSIYSTTEGDGCQ